MKFKNVILIFALLFVQFCSLKIDFSTLAEVKEMNGDTYASNLIQTINTEVNAKGGKIESIQNLITELYNNLVKDQSHADKDWYERERFLNGTIYDTNILIQRLSEQIATSQKNLAVTNLKILRGNTNLKQYSTQFIQEKNLVINLELKRNEDKAIYKDNVYNSQNLLMALDQVMIALRKLRGSISSVAPGHVKATQSELRDRTWKKEHGNALLQIFSQEEIDSFVEVATEADQDGLTKLLTLLENLRRSSSKSLIDFDADEQKSLNAYKFLMNNLKHDIQKLEKIIERQKSNLRAYLSYKNSLTVEINEKTNLMKKNQEFMKQTIEIRRIEKLKYESDTRARNREKLVIRRIEAIVKEKLVKMLEFVKKNVNQ